MLGAEETPGFQLSKLPRPAIIININIKILKAFLFLFSGY
jgi:hypothetical protein